MSDYTTEAFTAEPPATRVVRLYSDKFLDSYLNPVPSGCAGHGDPECLCDVDVSLTAGMDWSHAPSELAGVHDVESLIGAASNIWLTKDLCRERRDVSEAAAEGLLQILPELVELARSRYTYEEVIGRGYGLSRGEWRLICEAVGGLFGQASKAPDGRIRELRLAGRTYNEIVRAIEGETGRRLSKATVGASLARTGTNGLPPRPPLPTQSIYRWFREGETVDGVLDRLRRSGYTAVWRQTIERIRERALQLAD